MGQDSSNERDRDRCCNPMMSVYDEDTISTKPKKIQPKMAKPKQKQIEFEYIITIIKAVNVPKLDMTSESDPFVTFECIDNKNTIKYTFDTLFRLDNPNPFWNCKRKFKGNINTDSLQFIIYDNDQLTKSDEAGRILIKLKDIKLNVINEYEIKMNPKLSKKKQNSKTKLMIKLTKYDNTKCKKTLLLIRHGESEWNEAQEGKNLKGMYSKTDHPLNEIGIKQAIKLNDAWKECVNDESKLSEYNMTKDDLNQFLNASVILSSPLARATQTCLITLRGHKSLNDNGVIFNRNLRELKNLGGADTSASSCGKDIIDRCIKYLKKYNENDIINDINNVSYNYDDVNEKWWTAIMETKPVFDRRINDFMNYIRYDDNDIIICVGHSLWIKAFFKKYLPNISSNNTDNNEDNTEQKGNNNDNDNETKMDDITESYLFGRKNDKSLRMFMTDVINDDVFNGNNNELYNDLRNKKIMNAGCVKVEMEFNDLYNNCIKINDVQMMFGSQFV